MADQTRKTQLKVGVDSTGAKQGFAEVGDAAKKTARDVSQAAGQTATAVNQIGGGADKAAGAVDRSARGIVNSIRRATAEVQSFGQGQAAYFEQLANLRGINPDSIAPYLTQLRAAERQMELTRRTAGGLSLTQKELINAQRQLPAQFTDIAVSLAAGQAPLTVLLQQGGQLKDVFGGIGPAFRGMAGYVIGLVTPLTILAGVAIGVFAAFKSGSDETSELARAVIFAGESAGRTAGQFQDMAAAIGDSADATQGKATEALQAMAAGAKVAGRDLGRFTEEAIKLERAGGPAVEETAKAFQSLADNPVQAVLKLNDATNFLTATLYEQIKALKDQGREVEAARVAQDAYFNALQQRTPQAEEALGSLERGWRAVKDAVSGAWDAMKGIGRQTTLQEQADAISARLESARTGIYGRDKVPGLQAELSYVQELIRMENKRAEAKAGQLEQVRALATFDKLAERNLDTRIRMEREIASIRAAGQAALKPDAEIESQVAAIRERYATKAPKGAKGYAGDPFAADREAAKEWERAYQSFARAAEEATGKVGDLTKTQIELSRFLQSTGYQNMAEPARELALQQAYVAITAEQAAREQKAWASEVNAAQREYEQFVATFERSADATEKQVQQLRLEAQASALVIPGYRSLNQAIELVTIARLEEKKAVLSYSDEAVDAIDREIEARKKLVKEIGAKDARDEAKRAAEDAQKAFEQSAQAIEESLTDALLRGFENGKGFAENFRDTVANLFKTMVLKPVVQAVVNPIAGALNGALGNAGGGLSSLLGGGGGGGVGGTLSSLGSVAGALGTFGSLGSAFGAGFSATIGGSTLAGGGAAGILAGGGAAGAGIAGTLGAAAPYLLAAYALYSAFDQKDSTTSFGTSAVGSDGAANIGSRLFEFGRGNETGKSENLSAVSDTVAGGIYAAATQFGGSAAGLAIQASTDAWEDGVAAIIGILKDGQIVGGVGSGGNDPVATGNAADRIAADKVAEFFASNTSAAIISGLQQSDLPKRVEDYFKQFKAAELNPDQANSILALATGVQQLSEGLGPLGGVFSQIAGLSIDAAGGLAQMVGGIDQLVAKSQNYVQQFYSRDEIAGIKATELQNIFGTAGIDAGSLNSKADFRALVDSLDITTQTGQEQLATLLNVSSSFAEVADYIAETNTTLANVASLAPAAGGLIGYLQPQEDVVAPQIEATNGVKDAVLLVADLVKQLNDTVKQNGILPSPGRPGGSSGFSKEIDYSDYLASVGGGA